jgi:xanthine/CO dehydrogenase XdhC/CoxF family maturation factor
VFDAVLSNSQEAPRSEFATSEQRTAAAAREWLKAGRRVVAAATGVLAGGPARVVTYGITEELGAPVSLICGGTVRVFVRELSAAAAETRLAPPAPSPPTGKDRSPLPTFSSTR